MAFSSISSTSINPRLIPNVDPQKVAAKPIVYFGEHDHDDFSSAPKSKLSIGEGLAVLLASLRSADSLKKKGNAYVFPKKGSKNLKRADYFYEAALNKYQPSYRKTEALEMAETLLKNFKDEDGIADVAMKYFDAHVECNRGEGQVEVAGTLLEYPDLSFEDGVTFKSKAAKLIESVFDSDTKESALQAYFLYVEKVADGTFDTFHNFSGGSLAERLLNKAGTQANSADAHKELGDIYYEGTEISSANPEKASAHYEQYLQTLEQFNGDETRGVLTNILALQSKQRAKTGMTLSGIDELRHLIFASIAEPEEKKDNPLSSKLQLANFEIKASQVFKVISELPKGTPLPFSE